VAITRSIESVKRVNIAGMRFEISKRILLAALLLACSGSAKSLMQG
jgi:hypothetical protein